MIDPFELADRIFGPYPPPNSCGEPGPQHLVCRLETDHSGSHLAVTCTGFWKRWYNENASQKTYDMEPPEFLEAEDDSAPSNQDNEGVYSFGL